MSGFPQHFLWGAATAAWQVEGGHDADGKGPSIWDTYSHLPGTTYQGTTGDVAVDPLPSFSRRRGADGGNGFAKLSLLYFLAPPVAHRPRRGE
ncbi:6-phospho-beta-glucosidase A [Klebsiella grimontii]|uniref:6-phospho-beta-glucosidase A n=1 Tax=Klebsiella grimontii TaxID=2058152 RepID=A0A7H4P2Q3_9ENTR|nr:6-phospho-beta-glucosidase A [Klebsiella grimontii]